METGLRDKVVVITGAGGGMGRVIAAAFAGEGARLLLVDRTAPDPVAGVDCDALGADVSAAGADSLIVQRALDRFGAIDVVVNAAGVVQLGKLEEFGPAAWDRIFDVNVKALFFLSQAAGRTMLDQGGGRIVNIASIGGTTATPGNALYGISKAAVIAITQQFAVEWGPRGIRCNAVAPGFMTNL